MIIIEATAKTNEGKYIKVNKTVYNNRSAPFLETIRNRIRKELAVYCGYEPPESDIDWRTWSSEQYSPAAASGTTAQEGKEEHMKVFISQKMQGLSESEIRAQREETQKAITAKFGEVEFLGTEPKTFDNPPTNKEKIEMLSGSLAILAQADTLVLIKPQGALPNGCFIEMAVAKRYGIDIQVYRPDYGSGWEEFG